MRHIAHISDLHFGTEDAAIAMALSDELNENRPDLLVVSGDLTQRARPDEFEAAKAYLQRLPGPQLVVPGNHDVPLYDVARRFLAPFTRFRRHIQEELNPVHRDPEVLVVGINTARSLTWKNGRVAWEQIAAMERYFCGQDGGCLRVVVTHHPFIPPAGLARGSIALVGRAADALAVIDECDVDLLLAGHLHECYSGDVRTYYPATRRSIVVAQAGTAISRRLRGSPNAYNRVAVDRESIRIEVRTWTGGCFEESSVVRYRLHDREWRLEGPG
jgi:3',5'-cyclic AMP phosphodiesterase CpdA